MTVIAGNRERAPIRSPRIKRATVIKTLGALILLTFVITPSLLFYFAGIGLSPILTGSMRPGIEPGDVLVTKTTPVTEVEVGDVIALVSQESGVLFTHRVVDIREQSGLLRFITKGDANPEADLAPYLASPNDVVPKSLLTVPWIGHPLVYLTSVQGRQASLGLIVTANIIAVFLWLFKEQIQQISERAFKLYRDLYVEGQVSRSEKDKEAKVYRGLFDDSQASRAEKDKEAKVYRGLFDDSQASRAENDKESRVYRDLFEDQRSAITEQQQQSNIYKDLFMQSQEEKDINEAEMAQMMNEMKLQQQEKETK